MTDDALIAAMQRPEFYPHGPAEVALVQTHISYVFLAGSEVYKVKKAVRFPFLDFSTLERRRFFCAEELRLNRRLAPDVYLEVVGIRHSNSGYRITAEDDEDAVEYAVHMRRLPSDRILTELLERGEATPGLIDTLVDLLARFHAEARADDEVIAGGNPSSVARLLENNFSSARRFRGQSISGGDDDAIQAFSHRFLAANDTLLRRRQDERRIRECHGDLHTEHVCCTDPIAIFDCIEFDAGLRNCDVAAEIAFLKMDLDYHDRADLADRMVSRYSSITGDADLRTLIPFYACYRAYVRGLVDSLTAAEQEVAPSEREAATHRAKRHFDLAYRYTWATNARPARRLRSERQRQVDPVRSDPAAHRFRPHQHRPGAQANRRYRAADAARRRRRRKTLRTGDERPNLCDDVRGSFNGSRIGSSRDHRRHVPAPSGPRRRSTTRGAPRSTDLDRRLRVQ